MYTYICVCHKNHGYSIEYRGIPLAPRMITCSNAGAEAQFPITEQITLAVTNIACNTVHNVGPRSILQILINRISEQLHF
jgi:hypothetical protein